jgi:hypothetical protein
MDVAKTLISQADWAREQGVSKQYVSKLVKTGKIVLVDGKIDPEDAARRLASQQDPIKRAKKLTRLTELTSSESTSESTNAEESTSSKQPESLAAYFDSRSAKLIAFPGGRSTTPEPAGPAFSSDPEGHETRSDEIEAKLLPDQLLRARIKREREEGRLKELERKRREGELVDAAEVREEQLRRASDEREALLNWPSRIAALMAAELGIEERPLLMFLRKYVRQHLSERSKA